MQFRVLNVCLDVLKGYHVAQVTLERRLYGKLQCRTEFQTVRREHELPEAAAEFGPVDALAGVGEKQLLDHVAHVILKVCAGRAALRVEVKWKVDVHVPTTRVCVPRINKGVPVGAQIETLSIISTG